MSCDVLTGSCVIHLSILKTLCIKDLCVILSVIFVVVCLLIHSLNLFLLE